GWRWWPAPVPGRCVPQSPAWMPPPSLAFHAKHGHDPIDVFARRELSHGVAERLLGRPVRADDEPCGGVILDGLDDRGDGDSAFAEDAGNGSQDTGLVVDFECDLIARDDVPDRDDRKIGTGGLPHADAPGDVTTSRRDD